MLRRGANNKAPSFNGLGDIRLERRGLQLELGGDGGQTDLAIEAGQQFALAGSLLEDLGIAGLHLTHDDALKDS